MPSDQVDFLKNTEDTFYEYRLWLAVQIILFLLKDQVCLITTQQLFTVEEDIEYIDKDIDI